MTKDMNDFYNAIISATLKTDPEQMIYFGGYPHHNILVL